MVKPFNGIIILWKIQGGVWSHVKFFSDGSSRFSDSLLNSNQICHNSYGFLCGFCGKYLIFGNPTNNS